MIDVRRLALYETYSLDSIKLKILLEVHMSTDKVFEECIKEMFRRVGLRYPNKKFTNNPH